MKINVVALAGFFIFLSSCNQGERNTLGEASARESLRKTLEADTVDLNLEKILPDKETAIKFAEVILFRTYGENKILNERPYEAYLIDKYWIVRGTLPRDADGGTFEIIFSSVNGQVIKLTHYR